MPDSSCIHEFFPYINRLRRSVQSIRDWEKKTSETNKNGAAEAVRFANSCNSLVFRPGFQRIIADETRGRILKTPNIEHTYCTPKSSRGTVIAAIWSGISGVVFLSSSFAVSVCLQIFHELCARCSAFHASGYARLLLFGGWLYYFELFVFYPQNLHYCMRTTLRVCVCMCACLSRLVDLCCCRSRGSRKTWSIPKGSESHLLIARVRSIVTERRAQINRLRLNWTNLLHLQRQ